MPITIDGTGSISGLSAGGLPDGCITAPDLDGAQSGSAPIYGARAWVNFNGTGTVAIRASGNVSSITDFGVGDYGVNFTTALPDGDYAVSGFGNWIDDTNANALVTAKATSTKSSSQMRVFITNSTGAWNSNKQDLTQVSVTIFR